MTADLVPAHDCAPRRARRSEICSASERSWPVRVFCSPCWRWAPRNRGRRTILRPAVLGAAEEVPVEDDLVVLAQAAEPLPEPRRQNAVSWGTRSTQRSASRLWGGSVQIPTSSPRLVDQHPVAVDEVDLRVRGEVAADVGEGAGQQQVVGVEPAEDLAPRAAELAIDRRDLAAVGTGLEAVDAGPS